MAAVGAVGLVGVALLDRDPVAAAAPRAETAMGFHHPTPGDPADE